MANIAEIEVMVWDAKPEEKSTSVFLRSDHKFEVSREHSLFSLGLQDLEPNYEVEDGWSRLAEDRNAAAQRIVSTLWKQVDVLPVPERLTPVESQKERMERRSFTRYGEEV